MLMMDLIMTIMTDGNTFRDFGLNNGISEFARTFAHVAYRI